MKEYELQKSICKYLELKNILFCGSMGGQYQIFKSQRIKSKQTGYKKGFPDMFIYEPKGPYNGLAIELKTSIGKPTKEQKEWNVALNKRGYKAVITYGLQETLNEIDKYLKL